MYRVLVIVDMQNDFITGSLGSPEAETAEINLYHWLNAFPYDEIIMTKDTHYKDYLNTPEGQKLPIEHCINGTWGYEISDKIKEASPNKAYSVRKSSFGYSHWDGMFCCDNLSIDICGLVTDICVVTNALLLKTYYPNANIRVISHCCAGTTPEKHNAALEIMRSCQIEVI